MARAGATAEGFGRSVAKANQGLQLVSDRKVARGISEVAKELASGADASQLFGDALYRLSYSFKGSLGLLAAAGVGFAIFSKFKKDIDESEKAYKELEQELNKPLSVEAALGPAGITEQLDLAIKKTEALKKASESLGAKVQRAAILGQPDEYYNTTTGKVEKADKTIKGDEEISKGLERQTQLYGALEQATQKQADISYQTLEVDKEAGTIAKIRADEAEAHAKNQLELTSKGTDAVVASFFIDKAITDSANEKVRIAERQAAIERINIDLKKSELNIENQRSTTSQKSFDIAERELHAALEKKSADSAVNDPQNQLAIDTAQRKVDLAREQRDLEELQYKTAYKIEDIQHGDLVDGQKKIEILRAQLVELDKQSELQKSIGDLSGERKSDFAYNVANEQLFQAKYSQYNKNQQELSADQLAQQKYNNFRDAAYGQEQEFLKYPDRYNQRDIQGNRGGALSSSYRSAADVDAARENAFDKQFHPDRLQGPKLGPSPKDLADSKDTTSQAVEKIEGYVATLASTLTAA